MVRSLRPRLLLAALVLLLAPGVSFAQTGNIAGTARDSSGLPLPGVTVEVTSPALIGKIPSTQTDGNGRYQIVSLPVGIYKVTFKLDRFQTFERSGIELSSDFTAPVNAEMKIGQTAETVTVFATTNQVDVVNARQRQVFTGEELRDLPTTRDLPSLVNLVPGISIQSSSNLGPGMGNVQTICSGGGGGFTDHFLGAAFSYTASGALSGCTPILNGFNSHSSMNDANSIAQGRIQVDGLGIQSVAGGGRTSYMPDIANAQEVTFTLSGSMGESENGGATINIVPRTGGNRYAGNYFTSYSNGKFYDRNNGTRTSSFLNLLDYDYDVNVSYGGPVLRDRLWFYTAPRQRSRSNLLTDAFPNANAGIWGANYKSDTSPGNHGSTEMSKNASLRLTTQATQRNRLNIFWDEQYTCENPCKGVTTAWDSPEASATNITQPLHLAQLSWTNPFSNRILLDGRLSHYSSHVNQTENRFVQTYPHLPRIVENGNTVQQMNSIYTTANSGSINGGQYLNNDNIQAAASFGYVTGSHNVKVGYQGVFYSTKATTHYNDLRLTYNYTTPAANGVCATTVCLGSTNPRLERNANNAVVTGCYYSPELLTGTAIPQQIATTSTTGTATDRPWCGSINLAGNPANLNDPTNSQRLPVPTSFTQYIPNDRDERAWYNAFYIQDQWTVGRFTLNGALRYDNSQSRFGETCVTQDLYTGPRDFCLNSPDNPDPTKRGDGVNFKDITPRWGVAWDVFGNGKTALKFNMGKYVNGAGIGGVYTASNVASGARFTNSFTRNWTDLDGDRIVDCSLAIPFQTPSVNGSVPADNECGAIAAGSTSYTNYRRFGRSPDELDADNLTIGLGEIQCGRTDSTRIAPEAIAYCDAYYADGGESLLNGWGKRQHEWQMGIGVQHEILPRLAAEVTYNRRSTHNKTIADDVGVGCDLYGPYAGNADECMQRQLDFNSQWYDFYGVVAPLHPNLPNGGGYLIPGFANRKPDVVIPNQNFVTVQTLDKDGRMIDKWQGVDVNLTLRARGGFRLSGGTSTGRREQNNCAVMVDQTDITTGVVLRENGERGCAPIENFQTNLRGSATYTIPWVDVLLSTTYSYRPGARRIASAQINVNELVWLPGSEYRATYAGAECNSGPATAPVSNPGCLTGQATTQQITPQLTSNTFLYGEGIRLFDIKLAKNIRFGGRRVNVGFDLYNAFNSDAATQYCNTIPTCGTGANQRLYGDVQRITSPRYGRFQVQLDF